MFARRPKATDEAEGQEAEARGRRSSARPKTDDLIRPWARLEATGEKKTGGRGKCRKRQRSTEKLAEN